jgi:hypothetical protein
LRKFNGIVRDYNKTNFFKKFSQNRTKYHKISGKISKWHITIRHNKKHRNCNFKSLETLKNLNILQSFKIIHFEISLNKISAWHEFSQSFQLFYHFEHNLFFPKTPTNRRKKLKNWQLDLKLKNEL